MNNYRDIIKAPIITEKSSTLAANNVITFSVDVRANKTQIKQAIEAIDVVKCKVEKKIKNIANALKSEKMEKAKKLEEADTDYDIN